MSDRDVESPLESATSLGNGEWDLTFQATPADHLSSRELPHFGFWAIVGMMCNQFGLPLLPSVLVLQCFGMTNAAITIVALFVLISVIAARSAQNQALVDGVTYLRVREAHLEIETQAAHSRLHWSNLNEVRLLRSWIYCHKESDVAVVAPRRILTDIEAESMVLDIRRHIESASKVEPLAPLPQYEPFDFCEPFTLTSAERAELLQNSHHLADAAILVDEGHDVGRRRGCMTLSLLLMMGAGPLIAATSGSNSQKVIQWCAACAAIWLPQLIWRWRGKRQVARQLRDLDEQPPLSCRHGINLQGICSWTEQSVQVCPWQQILFIADAHQMLVYQAANGALIATPKRALPSPDQTLQQSEHYWRRAREEAEQAPEEDPPSQDTTPPGPATESGNPYQPPA